MRLFQISGLATLLAMVAVGGNAAWADLPGADIKNVLARQLASSMIVEKQIGAWSVLKRQDAPKDDPVDNDPSDDPDQTTPKSNEMFLSAPSIGAQNHALLLVTCIEHLPSVSVLYEGDGKIVSHLVQLEVSFDGSPPFDLVATPMLRPDSIGINRMRGFRMIQQMRGHDLMTITRNTDATSWTFGINGLSQSLDQSLDQCGLGNQVEIGQNELTLFQMQLKAKGYPVHASGVMDTGMRAFVKDYQKKIDLPQTGWLDRETYDHLLSDIGD